MYIRQRYVRQSQVITEDPKILGSQHLTSVSDIIKLQLNVAKAIPKQTRSNVPWGGGHTPMSWCQMLKKKDMRLGMRALAAPLVVWVMLKGQRER